MKIEHTLALGNGVKREDTTIKDEHFFNPLETIVLYDGKAAIIEATEGWVQINCTRISVEALRHTLAKYNENFIRPTTVILQSGYEPVKI